MDLGRSRGDDNVPEVVAMMRQIWGRFETWSAVFVPVLATIQGLQNKSEVNSQVCVCGGCLSGLWCSAGQCGLGKESPGILPGNFGCGQTKTFVIVTRFGRWSRVIAPDRFHCVPLSTKSFYTWTPIRCISINYVRILLYYYVLRSIKHM